MRAIVAAILELAGLTLVVAAAGLLAPWLGLLTAGVVLIVVALDVAGKESVDDDSESAD